MSKKPHKTQAQFILEYFQSRPNQVISHSISKKEIEDSYYKLYKKRIEDSDRAIRKLHQKGLLVKVGKGLYKYDPGAVNQRDDLEDFTESTKRQILKRDGYKCVICGLGTEHGIALQVDHRLAKEFGGKATVENGQTLCAAHNFRKKTLGQMEFAKKIFIRIYEDTLGSQDEQSTLMHKFSIDILEVFERHNVDDHVEWHRQLSKDELLVESNMWINQPNASSRSRKYRAVKFAEYYQKGYSDTELSEIFEVSIGETGKLISAGLAHIECGFDVLATLDAIADSNSNVTVGRIKSIIRKPFLSRPQKIEALQNLGLDPNVRRRED